MKWFTQKNYWRQDIRKQEYIKALVMGAILLLAISLLFYRSILLALGASPVLLIYMKKWEEEYIEKRKQVFQVQFCDAMQALTSALSVGYSMENAMKEAKKDLALMYTKRDLIMKEFSYMEHQIRMSVSTTQAWQEFAERIRQEDVENFATVFTIAKKSGGNALAIMRNTMQQIQDKIEVKREIETVMTEKKLEFRVMALIPMGMLGYMYICFPDFMSALYSNLLGRIIMTICLGIYIVAYRMGKKIAEIEV